jgi:hypothetical protein
MYGGKRKFIPFLRFPQFIPPLGRSCQWLLLVTLFAKTLDLPKKKAARRLNLAAFKQSDGLGSIER